MEIGIIVAVIGLLSAVTVSLVNNFSIRKLNKKLNDANVKKVNAEADNIIFELKNKTIKDLQDQINQLRIEIEKLKNQEHIHLQEKVRLEQQIADLKAKNVKLVQQLNASNIEIEELQKKIKELTKSLALLKTK